MSTEEINALIVLNEIMKLPESEFAKVRECAEKLAVLVDEYGEQGRIALALLGSQLAAKK